MTAYPIIARKDIRKGDLIRAEWGVESAQEQRATRDEEQIVYVGGDPVRYRLMSRPTPPLPTAPGTIGWATAGSWSERCEVRRMAGCWHVYRPDGTFVTKYDADLRDFREGPVDESREEQIEKIARTSYEAVVSNDAHPWGRLPDRESWRMIAARRYDAGTRVLPTGEGTL